MDTTYDFDEAFYDAPYYGESNEIKADLARVLMCLPERVRDFVIERCAVLSIGYYAFGITWPARIAKGRRVGLNRSWIIVVSEDLSSGEQQGIIAHEIAHAYLGHARMSPDLPEDCEAQACKLVAQWGFSGRGADIDYCTI